MSPTLASAARAPVGDTSKSALALGLNRKGDLMCYFRTCSRILTYPLIALVLFTTVPLVPDRAALIGTEDVLQRREFSVDREKVARLLARQDVREQLASFGVALLRPMRASLHCRTRRSPGSPARSIKCRRSRARSKW